MLWKSETTMVLQTPTPKAIYKSCCCGWGSNPGPGDSDTMKTENFDEFYQTQTNSHIVDHLSNRDHFQAVVFTFAILSAFHIPTAAVWRHQQSASDTIVLGSSPISIQTDACDGCYSSGKVTRESSTYLCRYLLIIPIVC